MVSVSLESNVSTRRVKLRENFLYSWEGPFEKWSRSWVRRNFWRVRHIFLTEEDALQECALIFVRCVRLYQLRIDNPAWLMSLFKTAVANDWITFSIKDRRGRDTQESVNADLPQTTTDFNEGPLYAALANASSELKQVLTVIAGAPNELLELMFKNDNATLEKVNCRLCRLSGISAKHDVVAELRNLLGQELSYG